MSVSQFNFPTIIRFGAGAVAELPNYLQKNKIGNPLLVTDPVIAQLPFFQQIIDSLKAKVPVQN